MKDPNPTYFGLIIIVIASGLLAVTIWAYLIHTCPELPEAQSPVTLIVECDAHERLIGKIATEHYYNKLALDDVTAKFNACVMDLAVERGELPPLPGGE